MVEGMSAPLLADGQVTFEALFGRESTHSDIWCKHMTIRPYSATIRLFSDGQNRPPGLPLESSPFVDFVHVRTHHLYRSILVGKYDQGLGDQLGPNGCCDQAINSIQLATGAMVDGLKQARNFTSKTQVEGVVEGVVEGG